MQIKDGTVRWTDEQSAMKVFSEHLNLNLKDVEYTDRIRADVVMNARKLVYEDLSSKMRRRRYNFDERVFPYEGEHDR